MPIREVNIYNSVGNAIEYVSANLGSCPDTPSNFTDMAPLGRLSDYTQLDISDEVKAGPNQVSLWNMTEVDVAIRSFGDLIRVDIPRADIMEDILHEDEHASASRTVGFRQVRFYLTVFANSVDSIGYRLSQQALNPVRPVTKLALASTIGVPCHPSEGDVARLRQMGYGGIADLRRRIMRNNERGWRHILPVPGEQLAG